MTQGTGEIPPRLCPRCGGLMTKPPGSSLFWHLDNNHPRCDITNIVDAAEMSPAAAKTAGEQPSNKGGKSGDKHKK